MLSLPETNLTISHCLTLTHSNTVSFLLTQGEEPEPVYGAGGEKAHAEPERPECPDPAGDCSVLLGEAAEAGAQPPARHEAQPGETEPGATQVSQHSDFLFTPFNVLLFFANNNADRKWRNNKTNSKDSFVFVTTEKGRTQMAK